MKSLKWLAFAASLAVPAAAYALVSLTSAGGYLFDVYDTSSGELSNGSIDAYDGAYYLDVNGTRYYAAGASTTTLSGRNVVMATTTIGGLSVHREVYVPSAGGDYARYLEVVDNPGTSAVSVTLTVSGNLGSDSGTILYGSSSGDTIFSTADSWFGTDDSDAGGDPSLAHVIQGSSPRVGASTASLVSDNFNWTFSTSVPAGGRVALLTFAVQTGSRAGAMTEAMRLAEVPDDALTGLDPYLDDIINFAIAEPGAPRIRFDGPFAIEEGEPAMISITVEDPEGDPVTWSWDTDDDGTFGEMAGADSFTLPAGTTDGPGVARIGISASDGTNVTERYRTISVSNVAPTITSSPSLLTSVGASYRYQIELDDPAASLEDFAYTIVAGPTSMVVSDMGLVTWTPRETDVTSVDDPLTIAISVDDGDMGTAMQSWDLTVSPNHAPSDPTPIYPIGDIPIGERMPRLVVGNASDPDRDALTYFFEIDRADTFDTPALAQSGAVEQTPGYSYWYVPALEPGHWFWRAWVSDGTVETEPVPSSFWVGGVAPPETDAGPGVDAGGVVRIDGGVVPVRERDDSGCSAVPGSSGGGSSLFLLALVVFAWRIWRVRLR